MDAVAVIAASGGAWAFLAFAPYLLRLLRERLALARAKHPSLAGHARIARAVARLVPRYAYGVGEFFGCDGADDEIVSLRRRSFVRMADEFARRFPETFALTRRSKGGLSDLRFTSAHRVPFQFEPLVTERFPSAAFLRSSAGTTVTDVDGNVFVDLSGSYGVNVFGYDAYKECVDEGVRRARDLGPVLGAYHPVVVENVERLRRLSGLDEVSFHMSGTEAVMQAVRLARYHTDRPKILRFAGSYHGWWDEVQPGVGGGATARDTLTLRDVDERSLTVIRERRDIACVLVNPIQALHPNAGAPGDSTLVSSARSAGFDRAAYSDWLRRVRRACDASGAALVLDDVFLGFRLAKGGSQEYFGVRADLVTWGKTLGGGLPVGVVCGRAGLMKRYRDDRPVDVCFARGTFNAHPYVMTAMNAFLRRLDSPEWTRAFDRLDDVWNARVDELNERLRSEDLPVEVRNLSTVATIRYTAPGRFNWMLQYYLRLHGLALSWVGTGRLIFSLNFSDEDFGRVADRFMAAARAMRDDGWFAAPPGLTDAAIHRRVLLEIARHVVRGGLRSDPALGNAVKARATQASVVLDS